MERYERIKAAIENMDTAERVALHNAWCDAANYPDEYIYSMDEFDDIMQGQSPWEVARTCYFGDFAPTHNYFWFNGYGNACSADFPDISAEDIAEYIDRESDSLDNEAIAEILEEGGEEEDE